MKSSTAASHFSSQDLLNLIHLSPSVARMEKSARNALLLLAQTPEAPEAQKLWKILQKEKEQFMKANVTFQKSVKKAVDTFETEATHIKKQAQQEHLQKVRSASELESAVKAEKLLHSLDSAS